MDKMNPLILVLAVLACMPLLALVAVIVFWLFVQATGAMLGFIAVILFVWGFSVISNWWEGRV